MANILDSWFFRYADTFSINHRGDMVLKLSLIEKEIKNIFAQAEKIINLKKRDSRYPIHFKKICLDIVRERYKFIPEPAGRIDGFCYPENHNDFTLTLDEKYDRLVHADNLYTKSIKGLTEDILEDYLIRNLHLIEDGMQFISRQFTVENGRLDILARDKNGPCA